MSNVLIGIIGVILFIGLALAGALFLGPRFQESRNNSIASAQVAGMKQVADAISLYRLSEGRDDLPRNSGTIIATLKNAGYLKSPVIDVTGRNTEIWYSPTDHARTMHVMLGAQEASICDAVNRQAGNGTTKTGLDFDNVVGQLGCIDFGGGNRVIYVSA
jgi:hypothetical protein